jgi:cysteinyl-tRNA synthetase
MHGEFLTMPKADAPPGEADRMSKSSGEFLTLDALVAHGCDPLAYRYFLLTAHYRQQLAFSWEALDAAAHALGNLRRQVLDVRGRYDGSQQPIQDHATRFRQAVENDLNMPQALAAMWGLFRHEDAMPGEIYATLLAMDEVLGLGVAQMQAEALAISEEEIQRLIDERTAARGERDYARADEIRSQLAAKGVVLEDGPQGTTWRRA